MRYATPYHKNVTAHGGQWRERDREKGALRPINANRLYTDE